MRIKHYYCLKNKFGLLRFLNRYEIPYQTEDSFEVLGTSVQVSDKKFISIILCGNIADGSNCKQADHILSQMWKRNDKNSKSGTEVGAGQKLFERSNTCL